MSCDDCEKRIAELKLEVQSLRMDIRLHETVWTPKQWIEHVLSSGTHEERKAARILLRHMERDAKR